MRTVEAFGLLFCCICLAASAQGSDSTWKTLSGAAPLVIARGGFSGIFPDSSTNAYAFVALTSSPDTVLYCDVQLTKDGVGVCLPSLKLENSTNIDRVYTTRKSKYLVNGVSSTGYFPNDFTLDELLQVSLVQGIFSRTYRFDDYGFPILTVQDVATNFKPPGFWLNIQHEAFYAQHNLSMRSFLLSASRTVVVNYISSPELNFLKGIASRFNPNITKLVFRFLGRDELEPTTNQTYGSLLKNLTTIKTFASGIIVPKEYIWPVDGSKYLLPHTSVVSDAHSAGLEVYASGFANDNLFSYNYSYDPLAEYLSFVDNGDFSVDGVLSDFPITPSAAIGTFFISFINSELAANPLVISYNGASGNYPGSTDLAYTNAISDGADVIDCSVQMSKDGVPICLSSINLIESTLVAQTEFSTLMKSVPELGSKGIYTFDLEWTDIQSITPQILNPYADYTLFRNPLSKNAGKLITLADFLAVANTSSVSGVLINIENAAYLARIGLDVTGAVLKSLSTSGFDSLTTKKVMIQSTNSSVLEEFKAKKAYELVYYIDELVQDVLNSTITDIKSFAHSVVLTKGSVFLDHSSFLTRATNTVQKFHSFGVPVYVRLFANEFVSQAWDYFSDAHVELNTFVQGGEIDGIITGFPKTAAIYKRNKCLSMKPIPLYMQAVQPGALLGLIQPTSLPPADAPYPVLKESDVNEPPLPAVEVAPAPAPSNKTLDSPSPTSPNGQPKLQSLSILSILLSLLASVLLI
ncbi:hypothetical protein QQ045_010528 [Rhodiola kirilowii]